MCFIKCNKVFNTIYQLKVVSLLIAKYSDYLNKADCSDLYGPNLFMS